MTNQSRLVAAVDAFLRANGDGPEAAKAVLEAATNPLKYVERSRAARDLEALVRDVLDGKRTDADVLNDIAFAELSIDEPDPPPPPDDNLTHPPRSRTVDGATFILEEPADVPALWGEGENVLWAEGEALVIVGPQGVGKTTLAQQLALCTIGLGDELLGFPIDQPRRVLYIAADRPRQAARSMKRMVQADTDRDALAERLTVWKGPLPFDLVKEPEMLCVLAQDKGADVVVIDSLKDVARNLADPEQGAAVNNAIQNCLAVDVDVVALHHQRKAQQGGGKPKALDDVFGSVWLTAGAGSVVLVWGEAGDAVVELSHLKQPVADVGPLTLIHDHTHGRTTIERGFDLLAFMRQRHNGVTAADVAMARFATATPRPNQIEKARRQLNDAVGRGLVVRPDDPVIGGAGGSTGARYYLKALVS